MRGLFRQGAFQQSAEARGVGQLLRHLRRDGQPAVRDRPRPGERRRRLRAAEAGRVRRHHDHPDLAAGGMTWPSSPSTRRASTRTSAFMFRVKWDGEYVAGLSKMSALKRTTEPVVAPRRRRPVARAQEPGQVEVRRGDARARRHARPRVRGSGPTSSTRSTARSRCKNFRKDVIVDVFNEADQKVLSYQLFRCWVVRVPGAAGARRRHRGGRDRDDQARARGLGARRVASPSRRRRRPMLAAAAARRRSRRSTRPTDELGQVLALLRAAGVDEPERLPSRAGDRRLLALHRALTGRDVEVARDVRRVRRRSTQRRARRPRPCPPTRRGARGSGAAAACASRRTRDLVGLPAGSRRRRRRAAAPLHRRRARRARRGRRTLELVDDSLAGPIGLDVRRAAARGSRCAADVERLVLERLGRARSREIDLEIHLLARAYGWALADDRGAARRRRRAAARSSSAEGR